MKIQGASVICVVWTTFSELERREYKKLEPRTIGIPYHLDATNRQKTKKNTTFVVERLRMGQAGIERVPWSIRLRGRLLRTRSKSKARANPRICAGHEFKRDGAYLQMAALPVLSETSYAFL